MASDEWEMYVEDGIIVARFPEGMSWDADELPAMEERWRELVEREGTHAHVSIIETEESIGWDVLDGMGYAAKIGVDHGLQRWAIVADGIKQLAVRNRIEVPDVELFTTDDREEAMEWARETTPEE